VQHTLVLPRGTGDGLKCSSCCARQRPVGDTAPYRLSSSPVCFSSPGRGDRGDLLAQRAELEALRTVREL